MGPVVTLDVDVLLTLIQAARAELDRLGDHLPGSVEHAELAAAVRQGSDAAHVAMLVAWGELREELRRGRVPLRARQTAPAGCPLP
jgi:hypothetical protein